MADDYLANLSAVLGEDMNQLPQTFYDVSASAGYAPPVQANSAFSSAVARERLGRETYRGVPQFDSLFMYSSQPSIGSMVNPANINVGEAGAGGLYGGDVNYQANGSAYNEINPGLYLTDKKHGASNLSAAVQRAQYADYLSRFAPVEDYAVKSLTNNGKNTADLQFDLNRAKATAVGAGINMQGQQERAMGRYGLQYKGPNIAESKETTGSAVAAMNQARLADESRALSLLGGSNAQGG